MTDKQAPLNDFFRRHKKQWKDQVFENLKSKLSIHNFFKPAEPIQVKRNDETPTGEKSHSKENS